MERTLKYLKDFNRFHPELTILYVIYVLIWLVVGIIIYKVSGIKMPNGQPNEGGLVIYLVLMYVAFPYSLLLTFYSFIRILIKKDRFYTGMFLFSAVPALIVYLIFK